MRTKESGRNRRTEERKKVKNKEISKICFSIHNATAVTT
jgi:hypothetical protein